MPPFSPPPSFPHRCPGCCGDEYRHSQHRHGLRSQHGRWIFIIITARFMLPNVPGTAAISSEVSYTYHGGSIRDGARSLITFRGGGDIKKKCEGFRPPSYYPKHIIAILSSVSAFAVLVCCCIWIQNTHSLAHSDAQPRLRARRELLLCVCLCACHCFTLSSLGAVILLPLSHTHAQNTQKRRRPKTPPFL